jgi:hypothetical protein
MEPSTVDSEKAAYNYVRFDQHVADGHDIQDEMAFRASLHAGDTAADGTLVRLDDGTRLRLADLWTAKPLVMEFGSFT